MASLVTMTKTVSKIRFTAKLLRPADTANAGSWTLIDEVDVAVSGAVTYFDDDPLVSGRYGYRAGLPDPYGWEWSDEVLVDVGPVVDPGGPGVLAFAHAGAVIGRGAPEVSFAVPAAGWVRLEAFDLAGRRMAVGSLDAGQPGTYTLRLDDGAAFRPGIYFLRLTQGTSSVRTRAVVLGGDE